jgi:hypothetical protein
VRGNLKKWTSFVCGLACVISTTSASRWIRFIRILPPICIIVPKRSQQPRRRTRITTTTTS